MAENKRYYFLQMPENFFGSKRIKRLRHMAGGDTYTIIYLKMQLKAMNNNGILTYDGLMNSVAEEIAIDIEEETDDVQMTINYLQSCGLLEIRESGDCYLPYAEINVGSETASTIRSRKCRASKSVAMQQQCNALATNCNGDIDIEIDIDKDIDINNITVSKDTVCQTNNVRQVIQDAWNSLNEYGISRVYDITPNTTRYKSLNARIKQYGLENVLQAIENIKNSNYLQGKVNDWQITFDWFVKPNNFPKVLEGNYNNKSSLTVATDENFQLTVKEYPVEVTNLRDSKKAWENAIRQLGDNKDSLRRIYSAISLYKAHCQEQNRYAKNFDKWIETELDYWLEKVGA